MLLAFLLLTIFFTTSHGSIGGYICPYSRKKFIDIATKALNLDSEDISLTHFGANSFQLLGESVPNNLKTASCERLNKIFKPTSDFNTLFYGVKASKSLGCGIKLPVDDIIKV